MVAPRLGRRGQMTADVVAKVRLQGKQASSLTIFEVKARQQGNQALENNALRGGGDDEDDGDGSIGAVYRLDTLWKAIA